MFNLSSFVVYLVKQNKFIFILKIHCSLFFIKFLSSILMGTVKKSIPLNLIKVILKVGVIWKTFSRSLKLDWGYCLTERIGRRSLSEVREASNLFFILVNYSIGQKTGIYDYQCSSLSCRSD